jgi:mercuric ion binding protein
MKNLIVLAMILAVAAFAGEKKDMHKMDMSNSGHAMINVPTVQCDNCVKIITDALNKIDGIETVHIDLEKKMAHINYDAKKLKVDDIRKAIAACGYDADDVKRNEKAHDLLPKCCQLKR